ncbi:hypothetical protein, partial [Moraxella porci]|uniref:hypothetical protein n=1 Tax=Moraxella porci TaxID=1288392 RepID=UPI00244B218B
KTLQALTTDEQLAITQDNQALLNANEMQRAWEVESGDGVWDDVAPYRINSDGSYSHPGDKATFTDQEALIIKDVLSVALPALDVAKLMVEYRNAKTDKERSEILASALTIHASKAKKIIHAAKLGKRNEAISNVKIENLSKPLSVNTQNHILKRHGYDNVLMQIRALEKQGKSKQEAFKMLDIENRTFFNKNWSDEKIMKATECAKQDAIKNGVTSGNHTITYHGEKITINISKDGKVSTAFGHRKYGINDF